MLDWKTLLGRNLGRLHQRTGNQMLKHAIKGSLDQSSSPSFFEWNLISGQFDNVVGADS
jgi:hypothetical protein